MPKRIPKALFNFISLAFERIPSIEMLEAVFSFKMEID